MHSIGFGDIAYLQGPKGSSLRCYESGRSVCSAADVPPTLLRATSHMEPSESGGDPKAAAGLRV